jgi:cell division protein ZapA
MAALNITNEMLERDTMSDTASSILNAMDEKLDTALGEGTGN